MFVCVSLLSCSHLSICYLKVFARNVPTYAKLGKNIALSCSTNPELIRLSFSIGTCTQPPPPVLLCYKFLVYKHLNVRVCAVRLLLWDFKKSKIMFYTFKMRAVALVGASNHPSRRRRRLRCCCCCCCCRSPYRRHHHHYEKECPIACFIPLSCHFNENATVLMVCIIYVRCSQSKMNLLWFFFLCAPLLLPCHIAEVILPPRSHDEFQTVMKLSSSKRRRRKNYVLIIWYSIKYLLNTAQCGASSAISWENMPQIAHLLVRDEAKKILQALNLEKKTKETLKYSILSLAWATLHSSSESGFFFIPCTQSISVCVFESFQRCIPFRAATSGKMSADIFIMLHCEISINFR